MITWHRVADNPPLFGTVVRLYNAEWIDEDFNPTGTVEGFRNGGLGCEEYLGAFWNPCQDCWDTKECHPTFWTEIVGPGVVT